MEAIAAIEGRFAGSEGERATLHALRARLPEGVISRVEGFVAHVQPSLVAGLHDAALLFGGMIGFFSPSVGLLITALVTFSLVAEGAGRMSLFRWFMPKSASYNLVIREVVDRPIGTLVVTVPLDVPRWRPLDLPWFRGQRAMQVTLGAALVVIAMLALQSLAEPWGPRRKEMYVIALIVLSVGMIAGMIAHRAPGTGRDAGSGPAALLEFLCRIRQQPIPGVDMWVVFTGCGRAYQGGMEAFLSLHRESLTDPVLVVALHDPGRVPLVASTAEGPLFAQVHRPTGPALVERLSWAGVVVPSVDFAGSTDARVAQLKGYRAVALAGSEGAASPIGTARSVDVAETMARWYADDLARVAVNRPALEELARATTTPAE
jgi:hypothetical protein